MHKKVLRKQCIVAKVIFSSERRLFSIWNFCTWEKLEPRIWGKSDRKYGAVCRIFCQLILGNSDSINLGIHLRFLRGKIMSKVSMQCTYRFCCHYWNIACLFWWWDWWFFVHPGLTYQSFSYSKGHFRYFWIFLIIKNYFLHYLSN